MTEPAASTTRDRVRLAAAEVFAERGYAGAGLAEIVLRTRMTRGAVYFHFASKADLAVSLVEDERVAWRRLRERVDAEQAQGVEAAGRIFALVGDRLSGDICARAAVRLVHEAEQIPLSTANPVDELRTDVARRLRQAELAGRLSTRSRPGPLADVLVASFIGVHEHGGRTTARARAEGRTAARFRTSHSARVAAWWDVVSIGLTAAPGS